MNEKGQVGLFFLRMGLSFVFIFSAFGKLVLGFQPPLDAVVPFIPLDYLLVMMAILELTIGLLFFLGLITRIAGAVAALLMLVILGSGILLGMFVQLSLFKDVALLAGCLCLALTGSRWMSLDGAAGIP